MAEIVESYINTGKSLLFKQTFSQENDVKNYGK